MTLLNKCKGLSLIGEGAYGKVYQVKFLDSGRIVALKKILLNSKNIENKNKAWLGIPLPCIREINLLKKLNALNHDNVVQFIEVVVSNRIFIPPRSASICLVFEYFEFDLRDLVSHKYKMNLAEIKCVFEQVVQALRFLHGNFVCHRDLKSASILISKNYKAKLTDFGLARVVRKRREIDELFGTRIRTLTNNVVTIWYKAPELLLGSTNYDFKMDIWPLGCILFEMFTQNILFSGQDDSEMMKRILKLIGTPNYRVFDGSTTFQNNEKSDVESVDIVSSSKK